MLLKITFFVLLALGAIACVSRQSLDDGAPSPDGGGLAPIDATGAVDGGGVAALDSAKAAAGDVLANLDGQPNAVDTSKDSVRDVAAVDPGADAALTLDGANSVDGRPSFDAWILVDSSGTNKDGIQAGSVSEVAPDLAPKPDVAADAPAKLYCSPNPCVHGTCTDTGGGYKCACTAGWGGPACSTGSCSNLSCPGSAPCLVPATSDAAICYPSACADTSGLCMAENADGSGDAVSITGRNGSFNTLDGSNWNDRAKYFAYIDRIHGDRVCVFPKENEGGTPLVIPVGEARTRTAAFGQSNAWPNDQTCP